MKIAYLSTISLPNKKAHSVQIFNTCSALASAGAEVHLFAKNRKVKGGSSCPPGKWPLDPVDYFGVEQNFTLCNPPAPWFRKLVGMDGRKLYLEGALRHIRSVFGPGDVAFTRNSEVALEMARANVPVALEVHDGDAAHDPPVMELMKLHRPGPASSFLGFVSISQTLTESLAENGIPAEFCTVAHDGIDPAKFSAAWTAERARGHLLHEAFHALEAGPAPGDVAALFADDRPVIGYCGHFYPGRGIEMLLDCARRRPEWTFLLIGGFEDDLAPYRDKVREQKLFNVIFTGYVANARLSPFLWACDVLTMPYEAAKEKSHFMSPMKMFEYMATGRMIVAADWPQIREVLEDGRNALLHPRGDTGALEQSLLRAVADASMRQRLAAAARADVENYTWKARGRRIAEWLRERAAGIASTR